MVFMEIPDIVINSPNGESFDSDVEGPDDSVSDDEIQIIPAPQNTIAAANRVEVVSPEDGAIPMERMNAESVCTETEGDAGRTMG